MMRRLAIASACVLCVLLMATATAQERPNSAAAAVGAAGTGNTGSNAGFLTVNTWNWYLPTETWSYYNGSAQRLWMEFRNASDYIETNANNDQANMMNVSAGSNHYLGIYWTSTSTWSSSRLWYY